MSVLKKLNRNVNSKYINKVILMTDNKMRIKIIKDGPYCVFGSVPIKEKIITPVGEHYEYREGRKLPQKENYSLCRCGKSSDHPFCDGYHNQIDFDGQETASKEKYNKRAELLEGAEVDLLDDDRCAYLRFCHTEKGSTWELVEESDDEQAKELAVKSAAECLAGRLTALSKEGEVLEEDYQPEILILQDPEKNVSSAIIVKGNIEIESAAGEIYETRNSVALCRCGESSNKPFCDCSHIHTDFKDGYQNENQ